MSAALRNWAADRFFIFAYIWVKLSKSCKESQFAKPVLKEANLEMATLVGTFRLAARIKTTMLRFHEEYQSSHFSEKASRWTAAFSFDRAHDRRAVFGGNADCGS
jgi:hypothetical protein